MISSPLPTVWVCYRLGEPNGRSWRLKAHPDRKTTRSFPSKAVRPKGTRTPRYRELRSQDNWSGNPSKPLRRGTRLKSQSASGWPHATVSAPSSPPSLGIAPLGARFGLLFREQRGLRFDLALAAHQHDVAGLAQFAHAYPRISRCCRLSRPHRTDTLRTKPR